MQIISTTSVSIFSITIFHPKWRQINGNVHIRIHFGSSSVTGGIPDSSLVFWASPCWNEVQDFDLLTSLQKGGYCFEISDIVILLSVLKFQILRLSKKALGQTAAGQVVNLLSNDVNRFDMVTIFLHYLWILPFQVTLVSYLIWRQVGISSLSGIISMILLTVPVQGKVQILFVSGVKKILVARFLGFWIAFGCFVYLYELTKFTTQGSIATSKHSLKYYVKTMSGSLSLWRYFNPRHYHTHVKNQ